MDSTADGDDVAQPDRVGSISPPRRSQAYFRSLYKGRLDFRAIARDDPDFAAVLRDGQLDFRDHAAVRQLTVTLLRRDFGLTLELPPDRLCPPVPNRYSYVRWLQELMDATAGDDDGDARVGLDIGTGASCIYPLLACAMRPAWRFVATDIDAASLQAARANVARNGLAERIRVVSRPGSGVALIPLAEDDEGAEIGDTLESPRCASRLDFVMTNPPFYASAAEMAAAAAHKDLPPHAACTGAPVEMVYGGDSADGESGEGGGEVAFVGRMLAESAVLRTRVRWYTAMLGKLASVVALVAQLRARGIDNYAVAALVTSGKTRRWVLGWSYGARRPTVAVARGGGGDVDGNGRTDGLASCRHILPPITEVEVWSIPSQNQSGTPVGATIDALMRGLELASWAWDAKALRGVGRARENVWGRAWRRKKLRQERDGGENMVSERDAGAAAGDCAFGFIVTVRVGVSATSVGCRWYEGHSEALLQSFCGFLKTKLKDGVDDGGTRRDD